MRLLLMTTQKKKTKKMITIRVKKKRIRRRVIMQRSLKKILGVSVDNILLVSATSMSLLYVDAYAVVLKQLSSPMTIVSFT